MIKKIIEIYRKYEEIWNYLVVGGLTTLVSLIAYIIVTRAGLLDANDPIQLQIANLIKWIAGVLFAYFTNRRFVFKSTNENKLKEFITFTSSRVVTLILDMVVMGVMVTWLGIYDLIATIVSMVLVIIGNYILSKFFVFNKH